MYLLLPMTPATTGPLLTNPELHRDVVLHGVLAGNVDHADGHAHHALGVVCDRHGQAAHRHIGIAHSLDLLDAEIVGRGIEAREQPVEKHHDLLRRHLRCESGETDKIGEGHRDLREAVGDLVLAAPQPVGDRRRQDVQQQLLILAVFVLDDDILFTQFLDHSVESCAQLADLVARGTGTLAP